MELPSKSGKESCQITYNYITDNEISITPAVEGYESTEYDLKVTPGSNGWYFLHTTYWNSQTFVLKQCCNFISFLLHGFKHLISISSFNIFIAMYFNVVIYYYRKRILLVLPIIVI